MDLKNKKNEQKAIKEVKNNLLTFDSKIKMKPSDVGGGNGHSDNNSIHINNLQINLDSPILKPNISKILKQPKQHESIKK